MKKIFVVDDTTVNLVAADNALSEQYDVFTFASASNMFGLLDNVKPDLILLDIMMPEIDGFEALKMLKTDERYAEIPVIFLSAKNDTETKTLGFEMGIKDFISKPFTNSALNDCVKVHLQTA